MSSFDGTAEPLTYGQAIEALAQRVTFGTETQAREVLRVVRKEHGLPGGDLPDTHVPDPAFQSAVAAEVQRQLAAAQAAEAEKTAAAAA